jgi:hypothetical protein
MPEKEHIPSLLEIRDDLPILHIGFVPPLLGDFIY